MFSARQEDLINVSKNTTTTITTTKECLNMPNIPYSCYQKRYLIKKQLNHSEVFSKWCVG